MFAIKSNRAADTVPFEYYSGTASETIALGEALVLSSGKLTKCGATARPSYICVGAKNSDDDFPVIPVLATTEFDTILQAAGTSLNVGSAVTLHTDGLQVTATTTSGVFTISHLYGTAVGDHVTGYFL